MDFKRTFDRVKNNATTIFYKTKKVVVNTTIKTFEWIENNPEAAAAIIVPILVSGIHSGQSLIVSHRENKKLNRADFTWYDRSTGFRWDLKRKMTNNDRQAITKAKADGMDSIDILMKLNLI